MRAVDLAAAPPEVVGVILESGIADLRAFVRRRGVPVPATFAAADAAAFDPQPKLARGTLPLLVIHGGQDDFISPDEARIAFETATTARKELVLVPDRGHNDIVGSPDMVRRDCGVRRPALTVASREADSQQPAPAGHGQAVSLAQLQTRVPAEFGA